MRILILAITALTLAVPATPGLAADPLGEREPQNRSAAQRRTPWIPIIYFGDPCYYYGCYVVAERDVVLSAYGWQQPERRTPRR